MGKTMLKEFCSVCSLTKRSCKTCKISLAGKEATVLNLLQSGSNKGNKQEGLRMNAPITSYIRTCPMRKCIWTNDLHRSFSTKKKLRKWLSELESHTDVATFFMTSIQNTSKIYYILSCALGNVILNLQTAHFQLPTVCHFVTT